MEQLGTTTVTIYVRHSEKCVKEIGKQDRKYRKCDCKKWLYVYEGGLGRRVSTNTSTWKDAEAAAQKERQRLDPVQIEIKRLQAQEEAKQPGGNDTIPDALAQWMAGFKTQTHSTRKAYKAFVGKVTRWAAENGIENLQSVTADQLDKWRSAWGPEATRRDDRLDLTSQSQTQGRLKAFFGWAVALRKIPWDPTLSMKSIPNSEPDPQPLTKTQYQELLAATYAYDVGCRRAQDMFGAELRAIFNLQRWTGLRIIDVLLLPRTAIVGNVLSTKTQKTGADVVTHLPDEAMTALRDLTPKVNFSPKYFFTSGGCTPDSLRTTWLRRIRFLNKYLDFTSQRDGKPMKFHSHMLRDTFAVELLLAGCPLEKVSKLLTHESIRVTEKHYAPWIGERLKQLNAEHIGYMEQMGATFTA